MYFLAKVLLNYSSKNSSKRKLKEKIGSSVIESEDPHSLHLFFTSLDIMRKELFYSALTGLAVAGSIGITSFATTSNPAIPHIPSSQTPQIQTVNTQTSTPHTEVADTPDTATSDEVKAETQDDSTTLPAGSISEAAATKIALMANPGTTVTGFETDNEDGIAIYSISLSNATDVEIDPVKGTILKTEKSDNEASDTERPDTENDPNDRDQDGK